MTTVRSGSDKEPQQVELSFRHGTSGKYFRTRPDHPCIPTVRRAPHVKIPFHLFVYILCSKPEPTMVRGRMQYTGFSRYVTQPQTRLERSFTKDSRWPQTQTTYQWTLALPRMAVHWPLPFTNYYRMPSQRLTVSHTIKFLNILKITRY
jgi:hypothetical protein